MHWLSATVAQWHEGSRLLYAFVTVGTVLGIGLLFGFLSAWIGRKLGIDPSRRKHQ